MRLPKLQRRPRMWDTVTDRTSFPMRIAPVCYVGWVMLLWFHGLRATLSIRSILPAACRLRLPVISGRSSKHHPRILCSFNILSEHPRLRLPSLSTDENDEASRGSRW